MKWKTEKRKLSDLNPWAKNPRQANQRQADNLDESLDKFGVADPIIIQPDGLIIGGHFRYDRLARKHGTDYEVDVRVPERPLTDDEYVELNVRLNANSGEWDWDVIANNFDFADLEDWGLDLPDFGGVPEEPKEKPAKQAKETECPKCGHKF
jgi:ParB-like chromosome segregation protein Spo0J